MYLKAMCLCARQQMAMPHGAADNVAYVWTLGK